MDTTKIENLNSFQLDVLREIGNIGAGSAATALASMLSDKIMMDVPVLRIINLDEVTSSLGGPENPVVGISLSMSGDVTGLLMFIIEKKFFELLSRSLLNHENQSLENLTEMETSMLMEVGNILAGSYLNALAQMTGLKISLSPPDLCADMAGAVMSLPAAMFGMIGDKALMIQEDFIGEDHITSHLIMVPEIDSLNNILKRLGVA
ncbi:MAG: CheC, inhibitor of methylation [Oscillospiraceae bacterium]|jgi:chemotaxis protein CheC|nr:CheC, inhibitor of methylation [Oscillospiraceae bacterium]